MGEQYTFKGLTELFQPLADRLERDGMPVEGIARAFATYARCKANNARNRYEVDRSEQRHLSQALKPSTGITRKQATCCQDER